MGKRFWLVVLLFASPSLAADGWDWSLPSSSTQAPNAWIKGAPGFGRQLKEVDWKWSDIEPTEGNFDWSGVIKDIKQAAKDGYGVELHIKGSTYEVLNNKTVKPGSGPKWLKTKYKIPVIREKPENGKGKPFRITNYDLTDSSYNKAYLKMIASFKESGIADHSAIALVYVHNSSKSRGEEGNVKKAGVKAMNERLDAWAEAFKGRVGRLVYVGTGDGSMQHAFDLGMGQRSGFVEDYLAGIDNKDLCQGLNDGYLTVDENCPLLDGRAFGDENEEYGKQWTSRFGSISGFPHRYRESMLRVLQMRRNFLWTMDAKLEDDLLRYVSLSLGQNVSSSADAWVYLRESYHKKGPIKNFERWIHQTGDSTPAQKVVIPKIKGDRDPKKPYDYIARQSKGRLSFAVDDRFLFGPKSVEIKVTYWDVDKDPWSVEIPGCGSVTIKATCDGKVKTETIRCPAAKLTGVGVAEDFAIIGKPTVSFVRVIKL